MSQINKGHSGKINCFITETLNAGRMNYESRRLTLPIPILGKEKELS